jgi:hypothetical protein
MRPYLHASKLSLHAKLSEGESWEGQDSGGAAELDWLVARDIAKSGVGFATPCLELAGLGVFAEMLGGLLALCHLWLMGLGTCIRSRERMPLDPVMFSPPNFLHTGTSSPTPHNHSYTVQLCLHASSYSANTPKDASRRCIC